LIGDEQDALTSDIMAPPRRSPQQPTAAKSAPAKSGPADDAVSEGTPDARPVANGAPAAGNGIDGAKDAAFPAATIADGVPALGSLCLYVVVPVFVILAFFTTFNYRR